MKSLTSIIRYAQFRNNQFQYSKFHIMFLSYEGEKIKSKKDLLRERDIHIFSRDCITSSFERMESNSRTALLLCWPPHPGYLGLFSLNNFYFIFFINLAEKIERDIWREREKRRPLGLKSGAENSIKQFHMVKQGSGTQFRVLLLLSLRVCISRKLKS